MKNRFSSCFTLIELLVIIAIVGLLAAMLLPAFHKPAYAQGVSLGNNTHYGNTAFVVTNVPITGTAESFTNATRGALTSGFSTNTASAGLVLLERVLYNTNTVAINVFTTSGTNVLGFVGQVLSNGAALTLSRYPVIDNAEYSAVTQKSPDGAGSANSSNRQTVVGYERWGTVQ